MDKTSKLSEELTEKVGLVVERVEEVDMEEDSVNYKVLFLLDPGVENIHSTIGLQTDDREFFSQFQINTEYSMSFLKKEDKGKPIAIQKAN